MNYTAVNPKKVAYYRFPEERNFTGVVKDNGGNIAYYLNDCFHRADGPALLYADGSFHYYQHSKLHREDGPAIIYPSGVKQYWVNDEKLPTQTHKGLKDYLILRMFE